MPYGVDPRTHDQYFGIFVTPKAYIDASYDCLVGYEIAHYDPDYTNSWYDEFYSDERMKWYDFTVPSYASSYDAIYITAETFYQ